ncbi:alkyl sulfatase C-terminal domain-containing protein [Amycolatopsis methanolica]|nr:alkyl sulfatase C-terminal domain-containing protein [Amycolatopsis methanolica]
MRVPGPAAPLGYGAENGTWRNLFLTGAMELRGRPAGSPASTASPDTIAAMALPQLFDTLAVRVDGPAADGERIVLDWTFTDTGQTYRGVFRNGVLGLLADEGIGDPEVCGDATALPRLLAVLDAPDPGFAIDPLSVRGGARRTGRTSHPHPTRR